jgi:hypothetical protein
MTADQLCPLNQRKCNCDANAADKKLHPCKLARHVGKFIRLMGSDFEGEAIASATGLRRLAHSEGLVFGNLATLIENCNGEIEELKYSDADMHEATIVTKQKGEQQGYEKAKREMTAPPEFYDASGEPRWYEIACFCRDNQGHRLNDWEKSFVEDMPGKIAGYGEPKPKQAKHLLRIFIELGGVVDPKVLRNFV